MIEATLFLALAAVLLVTFEIIDRRPVRRQHARPKRWWET